MTVEYELIIDNFAGGGGASTGIEMATGRPVDIAINHDPAAIAMHKVNHPDTLHYCESVWEVDPRKVTNGRPVALVWLSPDCKHFSKAKGGKPVEKHIRGLAWVAVRWAATVKPRVIMLENVEEFKTWGPLLVNGKPDPKQKGRTFKAFVHALERQGYQVEWRGLRACDYEAPTIRKRFFMIARCDGQPIVWPNPTHGDPKSAEVKLGKLKPWRTAAEIIDWSMPCPSIFERKKSLAENTLRRIARGIQKFVIGNPSPFIVRIGQTGFGGDRMQYPLQQPLTTVTTKAEHLLVTPFIAKHYGGWYTGSGSDINQPIPTVTTVDHSALVTAFLAQYHTEKTKVEVRGQMLDKPIHTLDTSNRYGLVTSHLLQMNNHCDGRPLDEPMKTIVAGPGHWGEVRTFLMKYYGTGEGQSLVEPLATITTKDRFALENAELLGVPLNEEQRYNAWWCARLLEQYGDKEIDPIFPGLRETYVFVGDCILVDIGMRMLEPRELFDAQSFPHNYVIDKDYYGRFYPKAAQVARCGNAVPPVMPKALVRVNLPELCGVRKTTKQRRQMSLF